MPCVTWGESSAGSGLYRFNALALTSLKKLLTTPEDRKAAIETAQKIAESDLVIAGQEKTVINSIKNILAGNGGADGMHEAIRDIVKAMPNFKNRVI